MLGRAKRRGSGGKEFLPALAFPLPPNFVFAKGEYATKDVALVSHHPARTTNLLPYSLYHYNTTLPNNTTRDIMLITL